MRRKDIWKMFFGLILEVSDLCSMDVDSQRCELRIPLQWSDSPAWIHGVPMIHWFISQDLPRLRSQEWRFSWNVATCTNMYRIDIISNMSRSHMWFEKGIERSIRSMFILLFHGRGVETCISVFIHQAGWNPFQIGSSKVDNKVFTMN